MLARRTLVLLFVILFVFGVGISQLFILRFSKGDIYPAYSSFRADPLGSKALHDSLAGLSDLTVERNQSPLHFLENDRRATFLYLGVPVRYFSSDSDFITLQKLAAEGNRVVIGFQPASDLPEPDKKEDKPDRSKKEKQFVVPKEKNPNPPSTPKSEAVTKETFAPEMWQLELIKLPKRDAESIQMTGMDLPISYHSHLGFHPKTSVWKTLYRVQETPVIIERSYGLGSLVLLADSYPLSNEALRKERRPALLATLLGSNRAVVFDETHFGVLEQPGVAALARRYRLHGVAVVGLFLIALFLWRNLTPLFPRLAVDSKKEIVLSGQTAHSGLISLLRRSVTPRELPSVCLAEWMKSAPLNFRPDAVAEASIIATQVDDSPLDRLAKINNLLNQQKNVKHHR